MAGRRRLRGGAVRMLGTHDGPRGRSFRIAYDALALEYGPLSPLGRLEASRVAAAWVHLEASTQALEALRQARERGTGRRPSLRDIERASKRVGLDDASYATALDKLRALAAARARVPATPSDLLAAMRDDDDQSADRRPVRRPVRREDDA